MAATANVKTFSNLQTSWNGLRYTNPAQVPDLEAPTTLSVAATGANMTGTFVDNTGGTASHEVERSPNGSTGWTLNQTLDPGVEAFADNSLADGTYYYRVKAVYGALESTYSNTDSDTVATGGSGLPLPNGNLVIENFEVSDLTQAGTACDLNSGDLFTWDGTYATSIVAMVGGVATRLIPLPEATYPGQNFTPKSGSRCMRVRYFDEINMMAEQRFSLGAHYSNVKIRFAWYCPSNFHYEGSNAKFAAFWTNVYDDAGDVTFQLRPTAGIGGTGNARLVVQDGGVAVPEVDVYDDFINATRDAGSWMYIAFELQPESTDGAADGIIRVWIAREGDTEWTQIYNKTNATFYEGGQGIHQGYLFGSAEGGSYVGNGDLPILVDEFHVSTASLVA